MNKWLLRLTSLFAVIILLGGCGSDDSPKEDTTSPNNATEENQNNNSEEEQEETVVITISQDEGAEVVAEKEVPIKEKAILMDVMKENFDIEEKDGFITSIEGISPKEDEQKSWMYFVNDEMASVGAGEYELAPGDKVTFDLQSWE